MWLREINSSLYLLKVRRAAPWRLHDLRRTGLLQTLHRPVQTVFPIAQARLRERFLLWARVPSYRSWALVGGRKPMAKDDRKHIVEHLYATRRWTAERIAALLHETVDTVTKDIRELKSRGADTSGRKKSSGRP